MPVALPIVDIYGKYKLPENLQLHMLRVAALAQYISKNWSGPPINTQMLIRVLLVHDIGNIVKIESGSEEFKRVQEKTLARFGKDDHRVTAAIAKELGFSMEEVELLNNKIFVENESTFASNDYNRKIAAYADQRVAPTGVMQLSERLHEAKERYKDKPGSSMNNPRTDSLITYALKIERQIQQFCRITLESISDVTIAADLENLKEYRLLCPS